MAIDEILKFCEEAVENAERNYKEAYDPHNDLYIQNVLPYRVRLRRARRDSGIKTCSGAIDCLANPDQVCDGIGTENKHPVCNAHGNSCILCGPENADNPRKPY